MDSEPCPRAEDVCPDPDHCEDCYDAFVRNAVDNATTTDPRQYAEGVRDGGRQGHGDERERIVAWLRERSSPASAYDKQTADAIERGEHWRTKGRP